MKYFNEKRLWNKIEDWTTCALLMAMFVLMFVQVVLRFIIRFSIPVLEEYSLYMFVWFVFLCSSNAFLRDEHIRVDFVVGMLPNKGQAVMKILACVLNIVFSAVVVYIGWASMTRRIELNTLSTTYFPMFILYLVEPVVMGLTIIRALQNVYYLFKFELVADTKEVEE